jgi:hypothetical protein
MLLPLAFPLSCRRLGDFPSSVSPPAPLPWNTRSNANWAQAAHFP